MTAADAVSNAQFTIGAALAGFLVVASLLGVLVVVAGWRVIRWAADRYRQADARQAAFLAETLEPEPAPTRAVLDTEPGIDLALRDECDRILAATDNAGFDRLRAAIRDEQNKGEQA